MLAAWQCNVTAGCAAGAENLQDVMMHPFFESKPKTSEQQPCLMSNSRVWLTPSPASAVGARPSSLLDWKKGESDDAQTVSDLGHHPQSDLMCSID